MLLPRFQYPVKSHVPLPPLRTFHSSSLQHFQIDHRKLKNPLIKRKSRKQKRDELNDMRNAALERNRNAEAQAKLHGYQNPWAIKCAVVVERPQVITPLPEPWLDEYDQWRMKWDAKIMEQHPHLSVLDEDKDKNKEIEESRKEKEKSKVLASETTEEKEERLEREKREARMEAIRASHKTEVVVEEGSRITEADIKNDTKSVYRKLDERLFLIVKKNRKNHAWQFPQDILLKGETLRQTAERAFKQKCNAKSSIDPYFCGHAPFGYYTYEHVKDIQKTLSAFGSKVFFYYAYYCDGEVSLDSSMSDYAWVTKEELGKYLEPDLYQQMKLLLPNNGKHQMLQKYLPDYMEQKSEAVVKLKTKMNK